MRRKRRMLVAALVVAVMASLAVVSAAGAATSPSVTTSSTSSIGTNSAVVHGIVNPNGSKTYYRFSYGLTTAYGLQTAVHSAGSGRKSVGISASVKGLLPGTTYHYRVEALSTGGAVSSSDRTFKTHGNPPPAVATGPAHVLSSTTATVTGVINTQHQSTTYYFQYGPALSPSLIYQTVPVKVASSSTPLNVSATLSALSAGTNIRYQLVAVHSDSPPEYGSFLTFLTFPAKPPVPRLLASTVPGREGRVPAVFVTSGVLRGPGIKPGSVDCGGDVAVRFKNRRRLVGFELAPVGPKCGYSTTIVFNRIPRLSRRGRGPVHLAVYIHYRGDGYLAPANTRIEHVTIG